MEIMSRVKFELMTALYWFPIMLITLALVDYLKLTVHGSYILGGITMGVLTGLDRGFREVFVKKERG